MTLDFMKSKKNLADALAKRQTKKLVQDIKGIEMEGYYVNFQ